MRTDTFEIWKSILTNKRMDLTLLAVVKDNDNIVRRSKDHIQIIRVFFSLSMLWWKNF